MLFRFVSFLASCLICYSISAHDIEDEHQHCGENGVKCDQGVDVVYGERDPNTPNSSPTTYTGHKPPTNSMSDDCEGSHCINYEVSYGSPEPMAGMLCTTNEGGKGIWMGANPRTSVTAGYPLGWRCASDKDGDFIVDVWDDCPDDPTNSDPGCLDDLPSCSTALGWGAVGAGAFVGMTAEATAGIVIKGVVVSKAIIYSGGTILLAGAIYCVIAEVEG